MENTSYPELKIDQQASVYLMSAAKWNMFISIIGFVSCGFMILGSITFFLMGSSIGALVESAAYGKIGAGFLGIIYFIVAGIYLIPCIFLYNFSTKMQQALRTGNQELINPAFSNLQLYSKFVGILIIVGIGLSILMMLAVPFFFLANTF